MIERQFITQKMKEHQIEEFIANILDKEGYSHTEIQRTPLGEKVIIYTSKPGLIVGRGGANIKDLTEILKKKFGMENPQIEVSEIENPNLNAKSVAKHIVHTFERFGPKRFKSLGYKVLQEIINAGALGAEIIISGRGVPGARAKSWRFSAGYLKKSGDISENYVQKGFAVADLRSGSVGVKVLILTPDIELPDKIKFIIEEKLKEEEKKGEPKIAVKEEKMEEIEKGEEEKSLVGYSEERVEKAQEILKDLQDQKIKKALRKKSSKEKLDNKNGNTKKN